MLSPKACVKGGHGQLRDSKLGGDNVQIDNWHQN